MRKIAGFFIISIIIGLTSCGGGGSSSEEAKELLSQILTIVGIPQDIIVNICQDGDDNGICSQSELGNISLIKSSIFSKVTLGEGNSYELKNYDPKKKIIMELQDSKNIELNDGNFSLEYKGTTKELSILQSMVDSDNISEDDVKAVKKMDGKDTFYEILLSSMEKNLDRYMKNDMTQRDARGVNLKELGRIFKDDIPLKNLPTRIKEQCNGDKECIQNLIKSFPVNLETDEQDIYTLAQAQRKVKLLNDKLIESFTCTKKERKIIKHYGFEDLFNLKNRTEFARPSRNVATQIDKSLLINYDVTQKDKIFADEVRRLPRKFRKGIIYIGLKKVKGKLESGDKIYIGRYSKKSSEGMFSANLTDLKNLGWSHQAINNNSPTTDIYYNDFENIKFSDRNQSTLLTYLKEVNHFDVLVEKNTAVDFISVATCSLINPKAEIKEALNVFSCPKDTKLVKIIGGNVDAFSKDADNNATPSEILISAIDRPRIGYDELADNKFFLDTLNRPTGSTITQAQFSVGIKPLAKYLYQNDTIHIGSYELEQYARFKIYGTAEDSVFNMWSRTIPISNGERVLQTNLADINLTNGGDGSILNMLNRSNSLFDILIQNDTSVDFTYLNLCVKEE